MFIQIRDECIDGRVLAICFHCNQLILVIAKHCISLDLSNLSKRFYFLFENSVEYP